MHEAVDDDDDRAARSEQLRQDLATRASPTDSRERRPWTRRRTCRLQDSTGMWGAKTGLADASTDQSIRTCVRPDVPADHEARSRTQQRQPRESRVLKSDLSGVETTRKLRRDVHPEAEADHEAPSQPHSGPRPEPSTSGQSDVTSQGYHHSSGTNDFHTQRAEEESGPGVAASGPRAARGTECAGKHVGQHVDVRGRSREATPESGQLKTTK